MSKKSFINALNNISNDTIISEARKTLNDFDPESKYFVVNPSEFNIPDRYKDLDLDVSFEDRIGNVEEYGSGYFPLIFEKKKIAGYYNHLKKKIFLYYLPVVRISKDIFSKLTEKKVFHIKQKLTDNYYIANGYLVHELKHALNDYNIVNAVKADKISIEDLFKLKKLDEISAEIENILFLIKKYFVNNNLSFLKYEFIYNNILDYVHENHDYYKKLDEFMPIVIKDLECKFLNKDEYKNNYYIRTFNKDYISNLTKLKSDDGVYEDLRRKMLSFDVYNPETKETKIMDLSKYIKDPALSKEEEVMLDLYIGVQKLNIKEKEENKSVEIAKIKQTSQNDGL